ncbi:MAG: ATP phosphoribosyltransferase regulatory subunit [Christensenellales bacterium]
MDKQIEKLNILKEGELKVLELRALYELYGYKKFTMVKFEEYDFYAQNMDFLQNNRVLTFTGGKGKLMALRPDVTMSIVKKTKASARNCEKLYYTENVYRMDENTSEPKELSQIGIEHIGQVDAFTINELLLLASKSLDIIDEENILDISHMGFLNGALNESGAGVDLKKKLRKCVEAKNPHELRAVAAGKIGEKSAELLISLMNMPEDFGAAMELAGRLAVNESMTAAVEELEELHGALKLCGACSKFRLDFSIDSDEEYYNGIMFRGYVKDVPKPVLRGGRYDLLLSKMGKPGLQAVGFAIFFDELERYLDPDVDNDVDVVILYDNKSDMPAMMSHINGLVADGIRVWTGTEPPEGMVWEKLYRVEGKQMKEVANGD